VPVDFSEFSTKAVKYAARFAEQFGASLVLMHVIEPVRYPESLLIPPEMEEANRERIKLAHASLAAFVKQQMPAGIAAETVTRLGHPFSEISTVAKDFELDLIVLATHGHTGLKHLFLGSTAERVVRLAPCPVLTVREREHEFV
jgi:nucleotide-binding universal stress UspA family protein